MVFPSPGRGFGIKRTRIVALAALLFPALFGQSCARPEVQAAGAATPANFMLFPCSGEGAERSVRLDGKLVLNERFLPAGAAEREIAVRHAIREQLKFVPAALLFDPEVRSLGAFYADVERVPIESVKTHPGTYGLDLAIDRVHDPGTTQDRDYVLRAEKAGSTQGRDPSLVVTYRAPLRIAACVAGGGALGKVDLPADPYLAYWMVPPTERRPTASDQRLDNPCADSQLSEPGFPSFYYYGWEPKRLDPDHGFRCDRWLHEGRQFFASALTWGESDSAVPLEPLAELVRADGGSGRPISVSVIIGALRPWTLPVDVAGLARALASGDRAPVQAAQRLAARGRTFETLDPGAREMLRFLSLCPEVLDVEAQDVEEAGRGLRVELRGRLRESKRGVDLRVFFGITSEDVPPGASHWDELERALVTSDLLFYIGHSGMGRNLDPDLLAARAGVSSKFLRRPPYQLIGLLSCRAYGEYLGRWIQALGSEGRTDLLALAGSQGEVHLVPLAILDYLDHASIGDWSDFAASIESVVPPDAQFVLKRIGSVGAPLPDRGYRIGWRDFSSDYPISLRYSLSHMMPNEMPVSSLIDPRGDILLFRILGQAYDPGFPARHAYVSYSYSPEIVRTWSPEGKAPTVLIAEQNVDRDVLAANQTWAFKRPRRLSRNSTTYDPARDGDRSTVGMNEVEVSTANENVVAVMPKDAFLEMLNELPDPVPAPVLIDALRTLPLRVNEAAFLGR